MTDIEGDPTGEQLCGNCGEFDGPTVDCPCGEDGCNRRLCRHCANYIASDRLVGDLADAMQCAWNEFTAWPTAGDLMHKASYD